MTAEQVSHRRGALYRMLLASLAIVATFAIGGFGVIAASYPLRHAGFASDWLLVFLLMTGESAGIHLPSEVILPVGGWLVVREGGLGVMGAVELSLVAAVANTIGSGLLYAAGRAGGRPLVRRYGKFVLLREEDIDSAAARMKRRPGVMLFVSRLMPVVRTYGGFPAGLLRLPVGEFAVATFAGSFLWCLAFVVLGWVLGSHWDVLRRPFELAGLAIGVALLATLGLLTFLHLRRAGRGQHFE